MATETRRVIWRHPRGIYEVIEVSGIGVFGVPYRYRETVPTPDRDMRGVARKEDTALSQRTTASEQPQKKFRPVADKDECEICAMYANHVPILSIASSVHRAPQAVREVLIRRGVSIRKGGRKSKISKSKGAKKP